MKRKAIFLLYRVALVLLSPLFLVYVVKRGLANKAWRNTLDERLGGLPPSFQQTVPASIWLHAVSVGEVLAAVPLIAELKRRLPQTPVFLSVGTLAGRETAEKRLSGQIEGTFFAPIDFVWCVRRVLRCLRPSVVVILETEIWPNLYREVSRLGCGLIVVNGRISDKALPSYRRNAWLFGEVLGLCDRILAQSNEMRDRFLAAGATPSVTEAAGNLKYDFQPARLDPGSPVMSFIGASGKPLWIAASTSADDHIAEEDAVIAAQRVLTGWRLIIAPRKPERFEEAAQKLTASGLHYTRRTALNTPDADVLLLDSIGELSALFPCASVVFMGGTLAERGGHNILEPAVHGKPVIAGPHLENFRDIETAFTRHNALLRIRTGDELADAVQRAAQDSGLGIRAREAAEAERGAALRAADCIVQLYESRYPAERCAQPSYAFLSAFAFLWKIASAHDLRRKAARARRLPVPVVSLGNITAGGTGKTPTAIRLLRELRDLRPGLLTRGYGRSISASVILRSDDHRVPVGQTGDEAQLVSLAIRVPIGIGGDRYHTGTMLLAAEPAGLLIMDDGFQHRQLHRDFDLVLIDALRPFGGGHLLPLGRLREPLEGLARASAFLISRADEAPNLRAIEATVRRYNLGAPIFHAHTRPVEWNGRLLDKPLPPEALRGVRAVAFCGLGNPESFWRSLRRLGIEPLGCFDYGDHHRYMPSELRRLAQHARDLGVDTLITTAKDAVNLGTSYEESVADLKLYWLEIGTEIDGIEELTALIRNNKPTRSGSPPTYRP